MPRETAQRGGENHENPGAEGLFTTICLATTADAEAPVTARASMRWAPSKVLVVSITNAHVVPDSVAFCQGPLSNRTWTVEFAVAKPVTVRRPET